MAPAFELITERAANSNTARQSNNRERWMDVAKLTQFFFILLFLFRVGSVGQGTVKSGWSCNPTVSTHWDCSSNRKMGTLCEAEAVPVWSVSLGLSESGCILS